MRSYDIYARSQVQKIGRLPGLTRIGAGLHGVNLSPMGSVKLSHPKKVIRFGIKKTAPS